jgi:membrane protein YdbS with pleckstrin-like domain
MRTSLLAGESMVLPTIRKHWVVIVRTVFWPTVVGLVLLATVGILPAILRGLARGRSFNLQRMLVVPELFIALLLVVLLLLNLILDLRLPSVRIPGHVARARPLRWLGILVALLIFAAVLHAIIGDAEAVVTSIIAIAIIVLAAWWARLEWDTGTLTITDQRVILEGGVLRRSSKVIPLDRVQDVTTTQGLIGRILDFGSIEIDTAGAIPNELFEDARQPDTLRDQVFVLSEQLRRGI